MSSDQDTFELQSRLERFIAGTTPAPDVAAIVSGGRRRQTRQRAELVATGVITVVGVVLVASLVRSPSQPSVIPVVTGPTPSVVSPAPTPTPKSAPRNAALSPLVGTGPIPRSPVVSLGPKEKLQLGGGLYMTVTSRHYCLTTAGAPASDTYCKSMSDGNQASGSISLQGGGAPDGAARITGVYTGKDAATIVIGAGKNGRLATIVKAKGVAGPVAYVVVLSGEEGQAMNSLSPANGSYAKVYDRTGRLVTAFP